MTVKEEVLKHLTAALEREPKIDLHHHPIKADFIDGILTLEGEVKDIAAKKLALEIGATLASVAGIVDRLKIEVIREPPAVSGAVEIAVQNGDVLLEGQVPSLSHKRLAGAVAWWVPGTQNVLNCLVVEPPEEDSDDEMTDALRLVLEKDPFVNADQIRVTSNNRTVTLEGLVSSEAESEMAEQDAWYIFGVDRVINKLDVRA